MKNVTGHEMIVEILEEISWLEPEQRERMKQHLLARPIGYSDKAEMDHMKRCALRAIFLKGQNEIEYLQRELKRQKDRILNTPEMENFDLGLKIEAAHQEQRWGSQDQVPPHHFIMVFTKLLGKLSVAIWDRDAVKFKHHLITIAAVCYNTHKKIKGETAINEWFYKR